MTTYQKKIDTESLIPMDLCAKHFPLQVHLAYAHDKEPNIFGKVYHDDAKLWLHEDLARIVCLSAQIIFLKHGGRLFLYDGLRTKDAQEKMAQSPVAKANPHWMEEPRLLSPPGAGAHPRAMAIDMSVKDKDGKLLDMGTMFDYLAQDQSPENNRAHRAYKHLDIKHKKNRDILNEAVCKASFDLGIDMDFLAQEWWDFRFKKDLYERYTPLSDDDLPGEMRMVDTKMIDDFEMVYAPRVQKLIDDLDGLADIGPAVATP